MNSIHSSFIHGANFQSGENVIIEEDVIVGNYVKLGHNVTLKSGTRIMNDVDLHDYVKTTGLCIIGNGVDARTGACISKSVIINDNVFIGPGVMTNHMKNLMHKRNAKEVQLITRIGYGAIIGSMSSLIAGLTVGENVVIAAATNVHENIIKAGVYGGNPVRKIKDLSPDYVLKRPAHYQEYEFDQELLKKYLPKWIGFA